MGVLSQDEMDVLLSATARGDDPIVLAEKDGVTIRYATEDDIPRLIRAGMDFYKDGSFIEKGLSFDAQALWNLLDALIAGNEDYGFLILAKHEDEFIGTIAGIFIPWILDTRQRILQETFWWVEPTKRYTGAGQILLNAYEQIGKESGAVFCMMGTHDSPREKILERAYKNLGYSHLEHSYMKVL